MFQIKQRFKDWWLEWRIRQYSQCAVAAMRVGDRAGACHAMDQVRRLQSARSPGQVKRMERLIGGRRG